MVTKTDSVIIKVE